MEISLKAKIEKEARDILDKFGKSLEGIKLKNKQKKEGLSGFRKEGSGKKADEDFRKRMFLNAPKKEGDFIIAEKKKW